MTPKHNLVTVALETGTKESGVEGYRHGKTVKVPVWDFDKVTRSFLLDPILFGNKDNLVNGVTLFQKYIVDKSQGSIRAWLHS
jgi:hypothetical protein